MSTHIHHCHALDPWNPLAYFAALGLLRVLDEAARSERVTRPRLHFADDARPWAIIECAWDLDGVIERLLRDAVLQADNPVLNIVHNKQGDPCAADDAGAVRDLKPSPAYAAEVLAQCAAGSRSYADQAAALFTELVTAGDGRTKPTAFHFTAGQQAFVDMVRQLREKMNAETVRAALFSWGEVDPKAPSLSWEGAGARMYALRASDPSGDKKGSIPGAHWLAFRGISFLPVRSFRGDLLTTGVEGNWKNAEFAWPIWTRPSSAAAIAALLRTDVRLLRADAYAALGVSMVLRAGMPRHDQGGYGSFAPAAVVPPAAASR